MAKHNKNIVKKCFQCGYRDSECYDGQQNCPKCNYEYKNRIGDGEYSINELYDGESGLNIDCYID